MRKKKIINNNELIKKIIAKKEFSQLTKKDVELAFEFYEKENLLDEETIRLTRKLLHKVFTSCLSQKLLSPKNKSFDWILRKHLSTRERFEFYEVLYERLLKEFKKASVIDLGAGVNGFGYKFFNKEIEYLGIESVGQLVDLTNNYFKKEKINGKIIHESLFDSEKIIKTIKKTKTSRVIFLFKVLDALEALKKDYSKFFLKKLSPLADKIVLSFATKTMRKKQNFKVKRNWILEFINENFEILDDFEFGEERYVVFKGK